MIGRVSFEDGTTFREAPEKFEAGTPDIAGAIGLGAAVDYLEAIGFDAIEQAEHKLRDHVAPRLREIPGVKIYGDVKNKVPVLSFTMDGVHPHDHPRHGWHCRAGGAPLCATADETLRHPGHGARLVRFLQYAGGS
jgi:selenocysteine lyase/cysteine desulfurase